MVKKCLLKCFPVLYSLRQDCSQDVNGCPDSASVVFVVVVAAVVVVVAAVVDVDDQQPERMMNA